MRERCRLLAWDSAFFGARIGRIDGGELGMAEVEPIARWAAEERVDCLYLLARADHDETVRAAEALGGHLVDVRVTLAVPAGERPGVAAPEGVTSRSGCQADAAVLGELAERTYEGLTRFFVDPRFDDARCRALYRVWLERSLDGFADEVRVLEVDGVAVGFVTCHLREGNAGEIGLVGLAEGYQGRGLGRVAIADALAWCAARGVDTIRVVTQARNVAAQRLYQASRFRTEAVELWYHCWFDR